MALTDYDNVHERNFYKHICTYLYTYKESQCTIGLYSFCMFMPNPYVRV